MSYEEEEVLCVYDTIFEVCRKHSRKSIERLQRACVRSVRVYIMCVHYL